MRHVYAMSMKTKFTSLHRSRSALLLASISAAAVGLLASLHSTKAEPPPPPPPAAAGYQQPSASSVQGSVAQYLINPRGDVDGLLLADNTIVRFPPHLGAQLVQTVQPQAAVKVDGYSAVAGTIHATTITNTTNGRSLVDTPPCRACDHRLHQPPRRSKRSARMAPSRRSRMRLAAKSMAPF